LEVEREGERSEKKRGKKSALVMQRKNIEEWDCNGEVEREWERRVGVCLHDLKIIN